MKKVFFIILMPSFVCADYVDRTFIERHYAQGLQGDNKKSSVVDRHDAECFPKVANNPDRYCQLKIVDNIMSAVQKETNVQLRLPKDFVISEEDEHSKGIKGFFLHNSTFEDVNIETLVTLALEDQIKNMNRKNLEDALLMTADIAHESLLYSLKEISMLSEEEELRRLSMISVLMKLNEYLKNSENREKILNLTDQPFVVIKGFSKKHLAAVGTAAFLIGARVPSLIAACLSR